MDKVPSETSLYSAHSQVRDDIGSGAAFSSTRCHSRNDNDPLPVERGQAQHDDYFDLSTLLQGWKPMNIPCKQDTGPADQSRKTGVERARYRNLKVGKRECVLMR